MSEVMNPSSSWTVGNEAVAVGESTEEPESKKIKLESKQDRTTVEALEHRLGGILCCAVCLDLPKAAVYQCSNGHLMCVGCFTHLLADARLRDDLSTCPNCRVEISRTSACRNLAVEKAISELPSQCQFCTKEFPRYTLDKHEQTQCEERLTACRYSRIGCQWRGPFHEQERHEQTCAHPRNSGEQVLQVLDMMDQSQKEEKVLYDSIYELLSFENIHLQDIHLKPYRTDDFMNKLFYESNRFIAFNLNWVVKARINNNQKDPTLSCEREMTYQVSTLRSRNSVPVNLHYLMVRGPFGDIKVNAKVYKFEFSEQDLEAPYVKLPLPDSTECNRLLASKVINLRLIMVQVTK